MRAWEKLLVALLLLVSAIPAFCTAEEVIHLTFWHALGGASGRFVESLIKEYDDAHPEVTIEVVYTGSYADTATKVSAALATGTLPNGGIIAAGPVFTGANNNYAILEFLNKEPEILDDILPGIWDYAKYGGRICAIPYNISTPVLFYNKNLLKQAGLDPEQPPRTWDELLASAKRVVQTVSGVYGLNMGDAPWFFKALLLQNGCDIVSKTLPPEPLFDRPEGIEAAIFWKTLVDEGVMPAGMHAMSEKHFLAGQLAFCIASSSRLGTWYGKTPFEMGVAFLPGKVRFAVPLGGATLVLFPKSAKEDAATWELIKWLISPENIARFSIATGYLPIRKSSLQLPIMQEFLANNPLWKVPFDQLQYAYAYWHFVEMGTMDQLLAQALEAIEFGTKSPDEAMKWAADELRKQIAASPYYK